MTILEKDRTHDGRSAELDGTALYDWDELVQEDRAHRLIYTDPAIFEAEMTQHLRRHRGSISATRARSRTTTISSPAAGLAAAHHHPRRRRQNPRAVQPLHPSRHHALPLGEGQRQMFPCPYHGWNFLNTGKLRGVPWPDGYACDLQRREIQSRAGAAGRLLSRLHLRHAQSRRAAAARASRRRSPRPIDEWLDRNPGGKVVVCEANRLNYKGNWKLAYDNSGDGYHVVFSHRSLLEMENRSPTRTQQGHVLLPGTRPTPSRCTCAIPATATTSRTSGRTSKSAPGGLWAVESAASRHGALRGRIPPPLRRAAP